MARISSGRVIGPVRVRGHVAHFAHAPPSAVPDANPPLLRPRWRALSPQSFVHDDGRRRLGGNPRVPRGSSTSFRPCGCHQLQPATICTSPAGNRSPPDNVRNDTMATIGYVTKREDGRYEGELKTLSVRASIAILPVGDKLSDNQPDFRVMSQGIEIGAGWQRIGQTSGKEYISLSISAPELGRTLYANLGRASGQSDPNAFALIWTPQD